MEGTDKSGLFVKKTEDCSNIKRSENEVEMTDKSGLFVKTEHCAATSNAQRTKWR